MNVYLITLGNKHATTYRKREALKLAKANPGANVYVMPYSLYHYSPCKGDITTGWDTATFKSQAERIY